VVGEAPRGQWLPAVLSLCCRLVRTGLRMDLITYGGNSKQIWQVMMVLWPVHTLLATLLPAAQPSEGFWAMLLRTATQHLPGQPLLLVPAVAGRQRLFSAAAVEEWLCTNKPHLTMTAVTAVVMMSMLISMTQQNLHYLNQQKAQQVLLWVWQERPLYWMLFGSSQCLSLECL